MTTIFLLIVIPAICTGLIIWLAYRREKQLQTKWLMSVRQAKVYHGYYDKPMDVYSSFDQSKLINLTAIRLYNNR